MCKFYLLLHRCFLLFRQLNLAKSFCKICTKTPLFFLHLKFAFRIVQNLTRIPTFDFTEQSGHGEAIAPYANKASRAALVERAIPAHFILFNTISGSDYKAAAQNDVTVVKNGRLPGSQRYYRGVKFNLGCHKSYSTVLFW